MRRFSSFRGGACQTNEAEEYSPEEYSPEEYSPEEAIPHAQPIGLQLAKPVMFWDELGMVMPLGQAVDDPGQAFEEREGKDCRDVVPEAPRQRMRREERYAPFVYDDEDGVDEGAEGKEGKERAGDPHALIRLCDTIDIFNDDDVDDMPEWKKEMMAEQLVELDRLLLISDINLSDETGKTALITASSRGSIHLVNRLIEVGGEYGLNLDAQDNEGDTALMCAIDGRCEECVEILIRSGANLDIKNVKGMSAILLAVWENNVHALRHIIYIDGEEGNPREDFDLDVEFHDKYDGIYISALDEAYNRDDTQDGRDMIRMLEDVGANGKKVENRFDQDREDQPYGKGEGSHRSCTKKKLTKSAKKKRKKKKKNSKKKKKRRRRRGTRKRGKKRRGTKKN